VLAHWSHLVRRFLESLWSGGPSVDDEAWVRSQLLPGEVELWGRMSGADRRHAVGVARRTVAELGGTADRPTVAAALLHDVGKIDAGIGPFRRALATVAGMLVSRDTVESWAGGKAGVRRRFGRYLAHDILGAELLADAGSDGLTVAWAQEHHLPAERWSVPVAVGHALKAADDD
jgi:HD domain